MVEVQDILRSSLQKKEMQLALKRSYEEMLFMSM